MDEKTKHVSVFKVYEMISFLFLLLFSNINKTIYAMKPIRICLFIMMKSQFDCFNSKIAMHTLQVQSYS